MKRLLFLLALLPAQAYAQSKPMNLNTLNSSAVITLGNTFQTVLAANSKRQSVTVQNNNAADSCWLFVGSTTATAAKSILLLAGQSWSRYYPYVPSDALQATCANTNDTLYIDTN
jgi:hypothetical protein